MSTLRLALLAILLPIAARGSIIFGKDNDANRTDPGNGVPWQSVGRALPKGHALDAHTGCVVYLGHRFVLTAEHVQLHDAVCFDGATLCPIDPSFRPVAMKNKVDLKVFRLRAEPGVPGVPMLPASAADDFSEARPVWHVGHGVGRVPSVALDATEVPWAGPETCAKRWSVNLLRGTEPHRDADGGSDYAYEALFTILGHPGGDPPGLAENEGAITGLDSGSGLFQQRDGVWYLIGIATDVDRIGSNTSRFGSDRPGAPAAGDKNYFVRIQTYHAELTTAMTRHQWPRWRWRHIAALILTVVIVAPILAARRRRKVPQPS